MPQTASLTVSVSFLPKEIRGAFITAHGAKLSVSRVAAHWTPEIGKKHTLNTHPAKIMTGLHWTTTYENYVKRIY